MNITVIEQVDNYLAGRLNEEALDSFEVQLLEDESLQAYVSEQVALREALKSESELLLSAPTPGLLRQIHEYLTAPAWSCAASLALVFLIPMVLLPSKEVDDAVTAEVVVWRNLEFTRSADVPRIVAPSNTALMLSIDAFGMGINSADIQITLGDEIVATLIGISADEQSLMNVILSPLPPADYRIEIVKPQGEIMVAELVVE